MKIESNYRNLRNNILIIISTLFLQFPFSNTVFAAPYVATLASPSQISAGNICSGSVKATICRFTIRLDNGTGTRDLTGLKFTTTGTYAVNELDSFFLWYNITNDLNSASLLVKGLDSVPGSQTFPSFTQTLVSNDTSFFWITTNVLQAAANRTLQVLVMDTANFSMAAGSKTGSAAAGGVQTIIQDVAAPTGNASQFFCSGNSPKVSNLTATGSNIQWYAAASGGTALAGNTTLTDGTHYFATQTVGGCESTTRFDVTVTIGATPSDPGGNASQLFCTPPNPTVANLTATGTSIQWYAAASGGAPLASNTALTTSTHYFATQTVGGCESTSRFDVTVTIGATPSAPGGNASQSFCTPPNPTVVNLTATGTSIQWYAAASGGAPLAGNTTLTTGTHYFATQTVGGCESTNRFDVTVTIGATPGAPTGSTTQSFCIPPNPTVADLVAAGTAIQWYAASTGGSPLASNTTLTNGNHYFATQTVGGCESTTRLDVTVNIVTTPAPPTGSALQSFCTPPTPTVANLVATGTSIQWYASASGGSPLAGNTALTDGTHYFATQTLAGNCESTSRLDVTVDINPTPAAPSGNASQSFCSGDNPTVADLAATGTSIQWYAASTGGSPLAGNVALTNGTHYFATQTVNGCESTSRFDVTVTVLTTPGAPTGNATQTFCSVSNPNVGNLSATGTNIQWYSAATGGSALGANTALVNNTHYFATQTVSGCESTVRFDVTVNVITTPGAPTGSSPQSFCSASNPTVADLAASGTSIQWYATSSGGSPLSGNTPLINNTHYFATQTVNGLCESTNRLDVTVTIIQNPSVPTGNANQLFCGSDNATVANLVATGTALSWYASSSGGSPLNAAVLLTDNTHYFATQTVNNCESTTRLDVTVSVRTLTASQGSNVSVCAGDSATISAVNIANGYAPYSVNWNNSGGTCSSVLENGTCSKKVAPQVNTVYTATIVDLQSCSTTVSQTVTVKPLPQPVSVINPQSENLDLTVCGGSGHLSYALNVPSSSNVTWTSVPGSVTIGDGNAINNVVTFPDSTVAYNAIISIRIDSSNGCSNTTNITIQVTGDNAPSEATIVKKDIGNGPILVYTDPSAKGYRWGYDQVNAGGKITETKFVAGQVYQAFIPSSQFLIGSELDTVNFWFWVVVYDQGSNNDTCKTRVYYNGNFRTRPGPEGIPEGMIASVVPSPNNGEFSLQLRGDLLGNFTFTVFDMLGREKLNSLISKQTFTDYFPVKLDQVASGLYSAVITGENGEKAVVKFIVKN